MCVWAVYACVLSFLSVFTRLEQGTYFHNTLAYWECITLHVLSLDLSLFTIYLSLALDHSFLVPLTSIIDTSCNDRRSELLILIGVSNDLRSGSLDFRGFGRLFLSYRLTMPSSGSSIIRRISAWSDESIGAIEMSRTARNLPQLLRCSFSSRKKFHTNRL